MAACCVTSCIIIKRRRASGPVQYAYIHRPERLYGVGSDGGFGVWWNLASDLSRVIPDNTGPSASSRATMPPPPVPVSPPAEIVGIMSSGSQRPRHDISSILSRRCPRRVWPMAARTERFRVEFAAIKLWMQRKAARGRENSA